MIYITSLGEATLKAIQKGYDTNTKIAKYLSSIGDPVTASSIGSRVSVLRKQGLVDAYRPNDIVNEPLVYSVKSTLYTINDKPLRNKKKVSKVPKTYAGMNEDIYNNLNFILYPNSLCKQLETIHEPNE